MAKKTRKYEERPVPSPEVCRRIVARGLLKGYREWVRNGRPGKSAAK